MHSDIILKLKRDHAPKKRVQMMSSSVRSLPPSGSGCGVAFDFHYVSVALGALGHTVHGYDYHGKGDPPC